MRKAGGAIVAAVLGTLVPKTIQRESWARSFWCGLWFL